MELRRALNCSILEAVALLLVEFGISDLHHLSFRVEKGWRFCMEERLDSKIYDQSKKEEERKIYVGLLKFYQKSLAERTIKSSFMILHQHDKVPFLSPSQF